MTPIVKVEGDVVCLVMSVPQAKVIRTLLGSVLPSKTHSTPVYTALCTHFPKRICKLDRIDMDYSSLP